MSEYCEYDLCDGSGMFFVTHCESPGVERFVLCKCHKDVGKSLAKGMRVVDGFSFFSAERSLNEEGYTVVDSFRNRVISINKKKKEEMNKSDCDVNRGTYLD